MRRGGENCFDYIIEIQPVDTKISETVDFTGPARILALDLGKRRIGLAISDLLRITAQGLPTLQRTRIRDDFAALHQIIEKYDVGLILIGNPLHMSGREGRGSEHAHEFGDRLARESGKPVKLWDERLTTVEAQRVLRESGASI